MELALLEWEKHTSSGDWFMNQMTKQQSLTFRARLKVSKALNPALYDTLVGLPQSDLSDFVLQVLKDWSRGRLTEVPNTLVNPATAENAATSEPSAVDEQVAAVSSSARHRSKQALPDAGTKPEHHQAKAVPDIGAPASEDTTNYVIDDRPKRTLADLGIKSTTDWNDAFDYITPPA